MTDPIDPEVRLRADLHDAASPIVADELLQRRLIDAATSSRLSTLSDGSRVSSRFVGSWMLPAAAAVVTLMAVGSVAVAQQLASQTTISGDPETSSTSRTQSVPTPSTTGPVLPPSNRPTSSSPTPTRSVSPTHVGSLPRRTPVSSTTPTVQSLPSPRPSTTHSKRPVVADPPPTSAPPRSPSDTDPPATCSTPDSGEYVATSLADFTQHMIGTWLSCTQTSVFGTDDAGLIIRADGTWAKLSQDASGHLVAGRSSLTKGDWQVIDDTEMNNGRPSYQLNLHIDGSGTAIVLVHISKGVDRLAMDNNGVYEATYVPTTEPVS